MSKIQNLNINEVKGRANLLNRWRRGQIGMPLSIMQIWPRLQIWPRPISIMRFSHPLLIIQISLTFDLFFKI